MANVTRTPFIFCAFNEAIGSSNIHLSAKRSKYSGYKITLQISHTIVGSQARQILFCFNTKKGSVVVGREGVVL